MEKRDPDFEIKMASVLHVYKVVEIVNEYRRGEAGRQLGMVTISYDEKPGIQALATTTPDRPPVVGTHPGHLRDDEYLLDGVSPKRCWLNVGVIGPCLNPVNFRIRVTIRPELAGGTSQESAAKCRGGDLSGL